MSPELTLIWPLWPIVGRRDEWRRAASMRDIKKSFHNNVCKKLRRPWERVIFQFWGGNESSAFYFRSSCSEGDSLELNLSQFPDQFPTNLGTTLAKMPISPFSYSSVKQRFELANSLAHDLSNPSLKKWWRPSWSWISGHESWEQYQLNAVAESALPFPLTSQASSRSYWDWWWWMWIFQKCKCNPGSVKIGRLQW